MIPDESQQSDSQEQKKSPNMEIYNAATAAARYEGTLLWQIFSVFLLIHTVIVGFVVQGITPILTDCKDIRVLVASLVGIVLSLLWAATYSRNVAHYRYYLARAGENEPQDWHLYGGIGRDFSQGKVAAENQYTRLSLPARCVRSGRMIPPVICVFLLVYVLGLILSFSGCIFSRSLQNQSTLTNCIHQVGTNPPLSIKAP